MVSAEALMRWKNDRCQNISVLTIIQVLEVSGLMNKVGRFILEEAMKQSKKWNDEGKDIIIHINISYAQFLEKDFIEQVRLLIDQNHIDVRKIVFEITESGFVGNNKAIASNRIEALREMGIKIALDDFGTGYSNFIYLKDMNVSIVKLDTVFIREALTDKNKMALLTHIVGTVHALGMEVCFEGVETQNDFKELSKIGPDYIQGYFFGKVYNKKGFETFFNGVLNQDFLNKYHNLKQSDTSMIYIMNEMKEEENIKKHEKHFTNKLVMTILPVLLLVMFGLASMCYIGSKNIMEKQLDKSMTSLLEGSMEKLDSDFYQNIYLAHTTSLYVSNTYQTLELETYENILSNIVESNVEIAGSGIWFERYVYQDQEVVCPYVYRTNEGIKLTYYYGGKEYDYFNQEYYAVVKQTMKPLITDPYYDETMDNTIITFSYPMKENGNFIGVVTVDLYLKDVANIVNALNPDENAYTFLVSQDNSIICGFQNAPLSLISQMKNDSGTFKFKMDDTQYEVYYDILPSTGWKAAIMVDTDALYKPVNGLITILIVAFILTVVTSIGIIVILIIAMNRQKKLEYDQKKNINQLHFKALKSSYHIILVANRNTNKLKIVYIDELFKSFELDFGSYNGFINKLNDLVIGEQNLLQFSRLNMVFEMLEGKSFISQDIKFKINEIENTWAEATVSRVVDDNKKESSEEILFMLRDINETKNKEIEAQEEKQNLILELKEKNVELFELGITDNLTRVYNRSGLNYYSAAVIESAREEGENLFLLIADINRLKHINDKYGHLKGDAAIKETAGILKSIKPDDLIVARTGGDEFVLLGVFDEKSNVPKEIIDSINDKVAKSKLGDVDSGLSVGYYWGKLDSGKDIEYYYRLADVLMYKNKRANKKSEE